MEQQKRQIAHKVRIKEVLNGSYVKEGGWEPNHVQLQDGLKVSRINIIGTIVDKSENSGFQNVLMDDGSGKISVRFFQDYKLANGVNIGDIVLVIGRIREYGIERYIVPEIMRRIDDKRWVEVRKLELKSKRPVQSIVVPVNKQVPNIVSPLQNIYALIKKLDTGDGADIGSVIENAHQPDAEKMITSLLEKGEIFEVRKGKVKVLE